MNIYNSVIEGTTGQNMSDVRFSQIKPTESDNETPNGKTIAVFDIKNSLIGTPLWRNVEAEGYGGGTAPYTKPADYTVGTLFDELDEATLSFTPQANSLAVNYGDAQYLTALDIHYDQLGTTRRFVEGKCDAGAVELPYLLTKWTGNGVDDDWANADNWSGGVPAARHKVTVPGEGGSYPRLPAAATVANLLLEPGAGVDLGGFALTADSIRVKTLMDDRTWYSVGFPFAVSEVYSEEFDANLVFGDRANIAVKSYELSDGEYVFADAETIAADKGYIVQLPDGYSASTVIAYAAALPAPVTAGTLLFDATYRLQANPTLAPLPVAGLLEGNKTVYRLQTTGDGGESAYVKVTEGSIAPFEAVMTVERAFSPMSIRVAAGDGTGAVTVMEEDDAVVSSEYYNLQGVRVDAGTKGALYLVKQRHASGRTSVCKIIR
jgi:hypothetical protein